MNSLGLVSIVIPTFNRKKDLLECIESLYRSDYGDYEIVIVDNASEDGTSEAVAGMPRVRLIAEKLRHGMSVGRNIGAMNSRGRYVLFLDDDCLVQESAISRLVRYASARPEYGALGPIVYEFPDRNRIRAAGTSINLLTGKNTFNLGGQTEIGEFPEVQEVQILPDACLVKREVLRKVGLFDENLFNYLDTDFCFRVAKAGYKVACVASAKVWHKSRSASSPYARETAIRVLSRSYEIARGRLIFLRRHSRYFPLFLLVFQHFYNAYYTIVGLRLRKFNWVRDYWRGVCKGMISVLRNDPLKHGKFE
jgi:GT2 family glycosyltransferase